MLDWDHVRFFLAVANQGTVSGAARDLGVSHATVLRNVAKLEAELGARLFDHRQSGYEITEVGRTIYGRAADMAEQAGALARLARGTDPGPRGVLRVLLPDPTLFPAMPHLRRFSEQHPQIHLQLAARGAGTPPDDESPDVDVMLQVTNAPPEHLVGRQLTRIAMAGFQAPSAVRGHADAALSRWIVWPGPDDSTDRQQRGLRQLTDDGTIVLEADSHARALDAVRAGIGTAQLAVCDATADLVRLGPRGHASQIEFGLWILTHPDLRGSARITAFMTFMADRFQG